ncbi:MAG: phosphatase PAP2 family protein [Desulfovibrionales bacterium]
MKEPFTFSGIFQHFRHIFFQEFMVLVILFCVIGGIWAFIEIADEVAEGETRTFDQTILETFRGVGPEGETRGPEWLAKSMRDITALGGITVLTFVTTVTALFLFLKNKFRSMTLILVATVGGVSLGTGLKYFFARERPDESLRLVLIDSFSFPSGHAMMSAIVYLTLAAMLARIQSDRRTRSFIIIVGFILTFAVGVSRIYLGVHYPTDVLGGWSMGIAWASIWWLLSWFLQRRGAMETSDQGREYS